MGLLLLVQFVNLSIDLPDQLVYRKLSSIYGSENMAINEMESLLELAIEWGSPTPDAFPEHDEQDAEDQKRCQVLAWHPTLVYIWCPSHTRTRRPDLHQGTTIKAEQRIFSPPPEAFLL